MADAVNAYIDVNGTRQSILTMCTDTNHPVLLIVHGGAGMPDRPLVQAYSSELADCYTVVCWDQRGSGFSTMRCKLTVDLMLSWVRLRRIEIGSPEVYRNFFGSLTRYSR